MDEVYHYLTQGYVILRILMVFLNTFIEDMASVAIIDCLFQDFDAWFNANSCLENQQLVERLHEVSRG